MGKCAVMGERGMTQRSIAVIQDRTHTEASRPADLSASFVTRRDALLLIT